MDKEVVLTSEGYSKLLEELEFLRTVRRREVAERIKTSIEFGDLSENSEYDDAKNEQAFVEGRIIQINEMLGNACLIDDKKISTDMVCVGCRVVLEELDSNDVQEYRLVGSVEADPGNQKISNESPVGRAIMGKKPGQIVKVIVPSGTVEYKVVKICK